LSDELIAYIYVLNYESNNLVLYDMDLEIEPSLAPPRNLIPTRLPNPVVNDSSPDDGKILHFEMLPGDTLPCGIGVRKYRHALTKFDLRRWTLAANGAREMHDRPLLGQAEKAADISLDELLLQRIANSAHTISFKGGINGFPVANLVMYGIMPLVYGALNLAGLGYGFASQMERVLWITACGITMALELPCVHVLHIDRTNKGWQSNDWDPINYVGLLFVFCVAMARFYFVLESFYSLRSVSAGVYVTVDWLNAIPHL
jgi:hypothetical protein